MSSLQAQTFNWGSLQSNQLHVLNANTGIEHGIIYGVGYGYQIKNKFVPVVANIEYSFASGDNILDDIKTKLGVQIDLIEITNFHFTAKLHGVIRRYENEKVRLVNFGSDLAGVVGYYRAKWFVAGELGFDKAIITHFKHSDYYQEQYPGVQNGWFGPSTGGNFYYGLQAGLSFGKQDLFVRAGKILTQDFKTPPSYPFYGQLGLNFRV